jgi:hypothetical protein
MRDDSEEDNDEMDEEDDNDEGDKVKEFKQKIVDLLEDNKLITKRAAKMDLTDFLQLLSVFNTSGIHFR